MSGRRGSWGIRLGLIGLVAILAAWGTAGALTAPAAPGPVRGGPTAAATPASCLYPCGGTGDFENITVEVTGVPQFYTAAGGCEAGPPQVANCQVFVPLNLAYTSTYSPQGDIVQVPVEPGNHAYSFEEPVGGTGFYASYNVDECNLPVPWNGCFTATPANAGIFNHPGVDTSPYYYVGPAATKFVPGCNGAPFGQIFGPNAAANGRTTIVLTYDLCPGVPADDGGGDGGNSSWNDTNGTADPCDNDTGDVNCLNDTLGEIGLSEDVTAGASTCPSCHVVMNNTIPIRVSEMGVVRAFLWNGTYHWTETIANRSLATASGAFTLAAGGRERIVETQQKTHPVTFTETGLPSGTNWSLWANGTTVTSSGPSITVDEPNGSLTWFALEGVGVQTGSGTPLTYAAHLAGGTTDEPFGVSPVTGPTSYELNFAKIHLSRTAVTTKLATPKGAAGKPSFVGLELCVAIRPAALAYAAASASPAQAPGIEGCVPASTHTAFDLELPPAASGAKGSSEAYDYNVSVGPTSGVGASGPEGQFVLTPSHGTLEAGTKAAKLAVSVAPVLVAVAGLLDCNGNATTVKSIDCDGAPPVKTELSATGEHPYRPGRPVYAAAATTKLPQKGAPAGSFAVDLVNGTYNITIPQIPGYWTNVGGVTVTGGKPVLLVVDGSGSLDLNFVPRTYDVTFTESGLPTGTLWSVAIPNAPDGNDPNHDWSSTGTALTVALPNGTSKFSIVAIAGYTAKATPSVVKVAGAAVNVAVAFQPTGHKGGGGTGVPGLLFAPLGLFGTVSAAARPRTGPPVHRSP